jgi:hypothetical protein
METMDALKLEVKSRVTMVKDIDLNKARLSVPLPSPTKELPDLSMEIIHGCLSLPRNHECLKVGGVK